MIRLEVRTKLGPEEAIRRAVEFFGPAGRGLAIKDQSATCAVFEGGGGGVEVVACMEQKVTKVEMVSREWDYQVKEFADRIAS